MKKRILSPLNKLIFSFLAIFFSAGVVFVPNNQEVAAESITELRAQAAALQAQIDTNNARAQELATEADSLRKRIDEFDLQINQLSTQIELTGVKIAELQANLEQAQIELDRQKELLKTALRALYKKGDASSFELLVGSASFSQFINEQDYLERLKAGIQTSTEKVIELKQQIKLQKEEQEALLAQQQEQKRALDISRSEKQRILDETQGEEAVYRDQTARLRAQQLEINRRIIAQSRVLTGGDGGYPWSNRQPFNDFYDCPGFDSWGMCMRSCTSWVAWRVAASGRFMPPWGFYLLGNARDWPISASIEGIPTGYSPQNGAVAVWETGAYGHVAYVEEVYPNGEVRVSEYNYVNPGQYNERMLTPGNSFMPTKYVYFP